MLGIYNASFNRKPCTNWLITDQRYKKLKVIQNNEKRVSFCLSLSQN